MGGGETRYLEMDFSELTKIIFSRIQRVEPENVVKIMGCIFLKEPSEPEMIELAFGPDSMLFSKINDAKAMLDVLSPKTSSTSAQIQSALDHPRQFSSFAPGSRSFSSPATSHIDGSFWGAHAPVDNLDFVPRSYTDSVADDYVLCKQAQFLGSDEQLDPGNSTGSYYYKDAALGGGLSLRFSRRTPSLPEFPTKACHYFYRGYCKHGDNCKYFHGPHGQAIPDDYSQVFSPNANELANEDYGFSPGSLERLEMEITALLRSRRGMPVSIASLPMHYFEKYGRHLQAEGYLTESQRHGKAGFSLTKLLARLKNIRLIDRPHGQHSVILAEDAPRYMECRNERSDAGAIAACSHQIYLTFPAESTFTEEDVSDYFKEYGPVRDVRIPCQDKRMFGFVSFLYPETVNIILMKRNPHYICGARVLVKPYREKSRPIDRTYMEKIKFSMHHPFHYLEMEPEIHATPRELDSSRLLRKHLIEEQERMIELERMRLSEFNMVPKPFSEQSYFSYGVEEHQVRKESGKFPLADQFSYIHEVLNNGSTSDDKARYTNNSFSDQESHIELPESPFASPPPVASSIFTVT